MKIKASEDLVMKFCTVDGEMTLSFYDFCTKMKKRTFKEMHGFGGFFPNRPDFERLDLGDYLRLDKK